MARSADSDDRLKRIVEAKHAKDAGYLIGALTDPDHRPLAASYLGNLEAIDAAEPLARLLDAADPYARAAAAYALGKVGAVEVLPRLRELASRDPEAFVRANAVDALGELRDDVSFDDLITRLEDRSWKVRGSAALALGAIGDPRAIAALRAARRRDLLGGGLLIQGSYGRALRKLRSAEHLPTKPR